MGYYDTQTAVRGSAPQMDVGALLKSGSLINEALGSFRQKELDADKLAKENELYEMKKDEYTRTLLDRQATDAANSELAKGRQIASGVLNTGALTAEADKNSFTPEEMTKYDMYKDSKTARAAGETALADKIDWQSKLSDVADTLPENNAVKESRVQMYEGIMNRLDKQGLPIPPTLVASMDQARLAEETENANKLKENTEAQGKNSLDQIANAKYLINNAYQNSTNGNQPVTNESGEVVGYTSNSASLASQKRDNSYDDKYDAAIGKGQTEITKELLEKFKGLDDSPTQIAAALDKYKAILKADPTIDPEAASAAILLGAGVKKNWYPKFMANNEALYTDTTPDALISKLRNTRTPNALVGTTTSTVTGTNAKASAASDLSSQISLQQAGTAQQLRDERAKILRGEDGRREDRVNDILSNAGLLGNKESEKEALLKPSAEDYKGVYNTGQGYSDVNSLRDKIAKNETGGVSNPYSKVHPSGALGKYGFVPSTAIEQMKALKYTGSDNELLSKFISTPSLQDTIMNNYMNTNSNTLSKNGVPVTDWTIWTSHNLGVGNAIKLAKGQIDDSVLSAIGKNLPKGMKPTIENYQAHWFDKVNDGDENKKYTSQSTKAAEVEKKAEDTKTGVKSQLAEMSDSQIKEMIKTTEGDSLFKDVNASYKEELAKRTKNDVTGGKSSATLRSELDALNKSGGKLTDSDKLTKIQEVNSQYTKALEAEKIAAAKKKAAENRSLTLGDILGVESKYVPKPGTPERDAALETLGLEHSNLDVIGGGFTKRGVSTILDKLGKTRLTNYDEVINGLRNTREIAPVVKPRVATSTTTPVQVKTTPLTKAETEAQSVVNTILNRGTNTKIELKNRASDLRDILSSKSKNTKAYKSAEVELQTIMKRLNDLRAY